MTDRDGDPGRITFENYQVEGGERGWETTASFKTGPVERAGSYSSSLVTVTRQTKAFDTVVSMAIAAVFFVLLLLARDLLNSKAVRLHHAFSINITSMRIKFTFFFYF